MFMEAGEYEGASQTVPWPEQVINPKTMKPEPPQWKYEDYSNWSQLLAKKYTLAELHRKLTKLGGEIEDAAASHLAAIKKTSSMSSNSQARAHARNVVSGLGEEKMAIRNAIELYQYYPEQCKEAA